VRALYVTQRDWLGLVEVPLFLVNDNHEQAALADLESTVDNVAVWAQTAHNANSPSLQRTHSTPETPSRRHSSGCCGITTPSPGATPCSW
jgi:hypothetical protein